MPYFQVSVESLMAAGRNLSAGQRYSGNGAGLAGAGAGTPAAAACEELVNRLQTAAGSVEEATTALAGALLEAGANYTAADQMAAQGVSLQSGGG